jgi:transcription antitermination protein NusB
VSFRTKARKRALDALYAASVTKASALELLRQTQLSVAERENQDRIFDYAEAIVLGVAGNASRIDTEIEALADGWSLERMPAVDRAILRLAGWEILFNAEVPHEVAIAEAVALAAEYSTDDSPKFVNGVLARLSRSQSAL